MTEPRLDTLDQDGALQEAVERVWGGSRADLFRGVAVGGATLLGALALPAPGRAATTNDVDILNYALTLEYLQASFYTETERIGALRTVAARRAAGVLGSVERAHVQALRKVLGRSAVKRPFFNFQGTTEAEQKFLKTAVAFEDLAVAAYKGQAPLIDSKEVLAAAISIHSVEARHAAWMRHLFGITPAKQAFDEPSSRPAILRIVASTRFIASTPTTTGRGEPRFTG
jgi:ferritin-like protein